MAVQCRGVPFWNSAGSGGRRISRARIGLSKSCCYLADNVSYSRLSDLRWAVNGSRIEFWADRLGGRVCPPWERCGRADADEGVRSTR